MGDQHNPLLGPKEFHERFAGRFFGRFEGVVVNVDDPRKLQRVKVRCFSVYGHDDSPWAMPSSSQPGYSDSGAVNIPPVGSRVWVEFQEGQPNYPIYSGGYVFEEGYGRPDRGIPIEAEPGYQANKTPTPMHAQGEVDGSDIEGSPRGIPGVPKSNFRGEYPHVKGWWTAGGHRVELDDTPGKERVLIEHKMGAHIEILRDGTIDIVSTGTVRHYAKRQEETIAGDSFSHIKGVKHETIDGGMKLTVAGGYEVSFGKDVTYEFKGKSEVIAADDLSEIGGALKKEVLGSIKFSAGEDFGINAGGNFSILSSGTGKLAFLNAMNLTDPSKTTLEAMAYSGRMMLGATDITGALSRVGILMQPLASSSKAPTPLAGDIGPFVVLGNLLGGPSFAEPAVLGTQLVAFLNGLLDMLQTWIDDYISHAHPWYSPAYTSPAIKTQLAALKAEIAARWLTPTGSKMVPALQSPWVYLT